MAAHQKYATSRKHRNYRESFACMRTSNSRHFGWNADLSAGSFQQEMLWGPTTQPIGEYGAKTIDPFFQTQTLGEVFSERPVPYLYVSLGTQTDAQPRRDAFIVKLD